MGVVVGLTWWLISRVVEVVSLLVLVLFGVLEVVIFVRYLGHLAVVLLSIWGCEVWTSKGRR